MRCGAKNGGLSCTYCYELPVSAGAPPAVDLPAIEAAVQRATAPGEGFTLFGGEPLLASLETLEALWQFGLDRYGTNGVQTSGRPIREEHWPLFHRYRVGIGFSVDGPGELNERAGPGRPRQPARPRGIRSRALSARSRRASRSG
jgi:sulfatase maturation enzyme AslB (radical SAM superfamily)